MKKTTCFVCCVAFIGFSLTSCKQKTKTVSPWIDLVNKRFAALSQHDSNAVALMYSDSAVVQSPNMPKTEYGAAAIRTMFHRYFITSPDMVYQVTRILPGDSSVTVEYTFAGTMQHLEKEVPAYMQGKYYKIKACTLLEMHNGKIAADISYFDQVSFLQQVGFFDKHN